MREIFKTIEIFALLTANLSYIHVYIYNKVYILFLASLLLYYRMANTIDLSH